VDHYFTLFNINPSPVHGELGIVAIGAKVVDDTG
jgi:hypothetical protein